MSLSGFKKYFTLLLAFCPFLLSAQSLERQKTLSAYVYNFTKYIDWPNQENFSTFTIAVMSDDPDLNSEFRKMAKSTKIKNLPISVNRVDQVDKSLLDANLIYIDGSNKQTYLKVYDFIEGHNILIISENYTDDNTTMIDLFDTKDNQIHYSVNKSNISVQGLTVHEEIISQGGRLIDAVKLYQQSQESLRSMQKKLKQDEEKLSIINQELEKIHSEIEDQKKSLEKQNSLISNQKKKIDDQIDSINFQKKIVFEQKKVLNSQQDSINQQSKRIASATADLQEQRNALEKGNKEMKEQEITMARMDSILELKTIEIGEHTETISKQRKYLYYTIIIIVLIAVLAIVILLSYKSIRRKNKLLSESKTHIIKINNELEASNEELKTINEELNNKNTELNTTLDQLKETQNQLIQSEKMASIGVLTAGIAHEMNNPINFVYAGVNCLKKDVQELNQILNLIREMKDDDDPVVFISELKKMKKSFEFEELVEAILQTVKDIELGADRTAEIVKGLRNFSRLDKEEWQIADIHSCIDDALLLLKNKYKNTIEIVKEYESDILELECIPGKINQVMLNIIGNSVDAISDLGKITIATRKIYDNAVIEISDTGKGMDSKTVSKIFDPFFTTKEIGKGIGLGLSITYSIIEEHRGAISVNSKPGIGTIFSIKLPIKHINGKHN